MRAPFPTFPKRVLKPLSPRRLRLNEQREVWAHEHVVSHENDTSPWIAMCPTKHVELPRNTALSDSPVASASCRTGPSSMSTSCSSGKRPTRTNPPGSALSKMRQLVTLAIEEIQIIVKITGATVTQGRGNSETIDSVAPSARDGNDCFFSPMRLSLSKPSGMAGSA